MLSYHKTREAMEKAAIDSFSYWLREGYSIFDASWKAWDDMRALNHDATSPRGESLDPIARINFLNRRDGLDYGT